MKAAQIHDYGPPDAIRVEDVPDPRPKRGEIVVAVAAAGVNPADYKFRDGSLSGLFQPPMPLVLGIDVAGTVVALGEGVTGFAVGDPVLAMLSLTAMGSYAEKVAVAAEICAPIPPGLDMVTAAALPTPGTTAVQWIEDDLNVQAGQRVLVTGATGAVGRVACQAAKARGAHVTAAVRARHRDKVRHADTVLLLDEPAAEVDPFDCIADTVGGVTAHGLLRRLRPGGVLSTVATDPVGDPGGLDVTVRFFGVTPDAARLARLAQAVIDDPWLVPAVTTLPLSAAAEAHRMIEAGEGGKLVLVNG